MSTIAPNAASRTTASVDRPDLGDLDVYRPPFVGVIVLAVVATIILLPLAESATDPKDASARSASWVPRRSVG